jgi:hypothetical protein
MRAAAAIWSVRIRSLYLRTCADLAGLLLANPPLTFEDLEQRLEAEEH